MSVQRFHAYHSGDPHKVGLWADPEGYWVLHSDHVVALSDTFTEGMLAERDRIRQAVMRASYPHGHRLCDDCSEIILSIIDGGE